MKCAISADLSRFPAWPHKTPRARATVYAKGAGNRTLQKIPAGKRGFFHAGNHKTAPEAACCRRVGLPGGGTPGPAAGRGLCAGACRGLGRSLRGPAPLWAGADTGPACGLLCRLRSRSCAEHPVPRVRGVFTGQPLPALRRGGGRGRPMALARQAPPGISGRVRGAGAGRCLLCAGARRGRLHAGVLLRGRCPAGGRLRLCTAALPTRKARLWHPAGRFCRGGGAGRAALRPSLPWGSGLCHGGCCPLLPRAGKARAGLCCLHRGRALRRRPFPCPGGGGALLRHGGRGPAGPRAAG